MTKRPSVEEVTVFTKQLLTALDDLMLRWYVGAIYEQLPESV